MNTGGHMRVLRNLAGGLLGFGLAFSSMPDAYAKFTVCNRSGNMRGRQAS